LSVSAITIVVTLVIVVVLLGRSRSMTELKVRRLAQHLAMIEANEEARALCREIREKYPEMCPGLDYTMREDSGGTCIEEWHSDKPKPGA
jgi:hypothetical protein